MTVQFCKGCHSCEDPCGREGGHALPGVALYKHKNNTDVAFEVLKSFYVKEKGLWKLKVAWWNIVHKPTPMIVFQKIQIPAKAWREDWLLFKGDRYEC